MKGYLFAALVFLAGTAGLGAGAQTKQRGSRAMLSREQPGNPYLRNRRGIPRPLESLRAWLKTDDTESLMIVVQGRARIPAETSRLGGRNFREQPYCCTNPREPIEQQPKTGRSFEFRDCEGIYFLKLEYLVSASVRARTA